MKCSKKVICGVIVLLGVMVICLAGLGLKSKEDKASEGTWEEEFYHCVDVMEERLENMDAVPFPSTWSDEAERLEGRRLRSDAWQAYTNFVSEWVAQDGFTKEEKEEIYKKSTLLILLLVENYNLFYGMGSYNVEPYEFAYYHGISKEKLLAAGNKILQKETNIDSGFSLYYEEYYFIDNLICFKEADVWEQEFHNCMKKYEELFSFRIEDAQKYVGSKETLEIWEKLLEEWIDYSIQHAHIGSGTGLGFETDKRMVECYRMGTLLMIDYYERFFGTYEFVYDEEEVLKEIIKMAE